MLTLSFVRGTALVLQFEVVVHTAEVNPSHATEVPQAMLIVVLLLPDEL